MQLQRLRAKEPESACAAEDGRHSFWMAHPLRREGLRNPQHEAVAPCRKPVAEGFIRAKQGKFARIDHEVSEAVAHARVPSQLTADEQALGTPPGDMGGSTGIRAISYSS